LRKKEKLQAKTPRVASPPKLQFGEAARWLVGAVSGSLFFLQSIELGLELSQGISSSDPGREPNINRKEISDRDSQRVTLQFGLIFVDLDENYADQPVIVSNMTRYGHQDRSVGIAWPSSRVRCNCRLGSGKSSEVFLAARPSQCLTAFPEIAFFISGDVFGFTKL
jgi:hypothetical protein